MKGVLTVLVFLISNNLFAQTDNKIVIGNIDSIQSKILKEKRNIWIYVPKVKYDSAFLPQKFPVVYLLDAEQGDNFSSVVGMVQKLSERNDVNGNRVCPQMIVVGIPNTKRIRDLTPTKDSNNALLASSGGGEQFMSFMEKELTPYIDSTYPTLSYKMLIGHSFGGLTVINALINHTKLFNSYIAIDPSMGWDNQHFLKVGEQILSQNSFAGKTLYVGIANTMEKGMNVNDVVNDTTRATLHIRSILEMDKYIKNIKPKGFNYASKYYENDNHVSVPFITEYDGLCFIFKQFPIDLPFKEFNDSTVDVANRYALHFKKLSELFGYKVVLPENELNALAYRFLQMKQYKKAAGLLNLYIDSYPKSANGYDSYGDYYIAIGDKLKAIEFFKKALTIKEFTDTRKKLNKLLE